jgi:hypothetical protein
MTLAERLDSHLTLQRLGLTDVSPLAVGTAFVTELARELEAEYSKLGLGVPTVTNMGSEVCVIQALDHQRNPYWIKLMLIDITAGPDVWIFSYSKDLSSNLPIDQTSRLAASIAEMADHAVKTERASDSWKTNSHQELVRRWMSLGGFLDQSADLR